MEDLHVFPSHKVTFFLTFPPFQTDPLQIERAPVLMKERFDFVHGQLLFLSLLTFSRINPGELST